MRVSAWVRRVGEGGLIGAPREMLADPARLHFVPMHMRAIHDYLSRNVDLVLRQAKIYG